jgi:mannose-6-phosphate isomerase-like protein (cupin superfamily)
MTTTPIAVLKSHALAVCVLGAVLAPQSGSQASSLSSATLLPAAEVTAAFATGRPLLETAGYKIHASRREAAGLAEVHVKDVDILYVLEGTATIVTGGSVVDASTVADGEIRGGSIRGGHLQHLAKGDVLVVPNGVPHQFTHVTAPFLYYVVKSTANGERR